MAMTMSRISTLRSSLDALQDMREGVQSYVIGSFFFFLSTCILVFFRLFFRSFLFSISFRS